MRVDAEIHIEIKTSHNDLQQLDILELITQALWDVEAFRNIQIYDYKIDLGGGDVLKKSEFDK